MLFNSLEFVLLFLPIVLGGFLLLWRNSWSRAAVNFLTLASLFFYGWWNPRYLPLIAVIIIFNFALAHWITRQFQTGKPLRITLVFGVVVNLLVLGYFKYAGLLVETVNILADTHFEVVKIELPLAISFFTFQQISFLVDTWKKKGLAYRFEDYAAYVTFFPHEIAGPIVRHHELIPQFALDPWRDGLWERMGRGMSLFAIGLVKKVFIADKLSDMVAPIFSTATGGSINTLDAWVGAVGFSLQIFFDFSAYTDMALGVALLFGYTLPINFDCPYRSRSIKELWQRWHMTLSRFLRDYLYVPLATSRWLPYPRYTGMLITMFLAGLWHGASWNFAAWGLLQGVGLVGYGMLDRRFPGKLPGGLAWLLTMGFWVEGAPLFRGESFGAALQFYRVMHGWVAAESIQSFNLLLIFGTGLVAVIGPSSQNVTLQQLDSRPVYAALAGFAIFLSLLFIGSELEQEFIYFRF